MACRTIKYVLTLNCVHMACRIIKYVLTLNCVHMACRTINYVLRNVRAFHPGLFTKPRPTCVGVSLSCIYAYVGRAQLAQFAWFIRINVMIGTILFWTTLLRTFQNFLTSARIDSMKAMAALINSSCGKIRMQKSTIHLLIATSVRLTYLGVQVKYS